MRISAILAFLFIFSINYSFGQSTFLQLHSDEHYTLDRIQTKYGILCDSLCPSDMPESKKNAVNYIFTANKFSTMLYDSLSGGWIFEDLLSSANHKRLTPTDVNNLQEIVSENGEWAPDENGARDSKLPWFHTFYKKQYDFVHVKTNDFFLVINPVLNVQALEQNNNNKYSFSTPNTVLYNSHGAEARGWITKTLGFYTCFTDNQEQFPTFVNEFANKQHQAVPGTDYFLKPTSTAGSYDYLQASGYIDFAAIRNYVDVTFGSGKHFIGDGLTSLFLTDFSSNMPFLQLRARIWKLNYECLYLELTPQYDKNLGDGVLGHKFATMHYVTYNATRWLNLGFFESVVFDRENNYEISYLNPLVLTTSLDKFNGEGDKAILGFTAKTLIAHHIQLYGQFMLNEFKSKEFFGSKGWYGNKWGVQGGGKYFDVFGIKNLDLQAEIDVVRPYTYTSKDTISNYTNYNQPLADPLGSGFIKAMGVIRYQASPKLNLTMNMMYYIQGVDTGTRNYGNDIFNSYETAYSIYGVKVINGPKNTCTSINLNVSYQLKRNFFIDIGTTYRSNTVSTNKYPDYTTTGTIYGPLTTNYYYLGFRLNAVRRSYDFF